jgi:TRAP-type C4-dicarboxylate transport system substrate-binding protein
MKWLRILVILAVCLAGLAASPAVFAQRVVVKLGTLAPEGSPWHDILLQMKEDWSRLSDGKVVVRIYPSGVLGGETDMIRKMRIGQIQAVAISGPALQRLEPGVACLQIPLMVESYEEFDFIRDRIAPRLESLLVERNFRVISWGDAGWVHFFTKAPARTLQDIRQMKLLTAAGDPVVEKLYKDFGFRVVPLPYTEVLTALQTGLIEAVQGPPLYALLEQWFGLAGNMIDIKWTPLVAATVVREDTWERIRPEWREGMLAAAHAAGVRMRREIRKLGDDAVPEMRKRGLNVITVDEANFAGWREEADKAYPKLRGEEYAPADLFDEVQRLRDEFRRQGASSGAVAGEATGSRDPE